MLFWFTDLHDSNKVQFEHIIIMRLSWLQNLNYSKLLLLLLLLLLLFPLCNLASKKKILLIQAVYAINMISVYDNFKYYEKKSGLPGSKPLVESICN